MQKQVSKQSLAVLALSILLAISMALTATFAAFSDSKTATGTIEFVNSNVAIVFDGWGEENALTLTNTDFEVVTGTNNVQLNAAAIDKIEALTVSVTGAAEGFKLRVTATATGCAAVTLTANTFGDIANMEEAQAVFASVQANAVDGATVNGQTFSVTVSAEIITA